MQMYSNFQYCFYTINVTYTIFFLINHGENSSYNNTTASIFKIQISVEVFNLYVRYRYYLGLYTFVKILEFYLCVSWPSLFKFSPFGFCFKLSKLGS